MNDSVCSICEGKIKAKFAQLTSCEHTFHLLCLMQWISEKNCSHFCPCPTCGKLFDAMEILRVENDCPQETCLTINNFICPVCLDLLSPPVAVPGCCGRSFCLDCLDSAFKNSFRCPVDRSLPDEITVFNWVRDSVVIFEDILPSRKHLRDIGRVFSMDFQCQKCHCPDRIDDLFCCISCSKCYHRECEPNKIFKNHPLIWICRNCATGKGLKLLSR